LLSSALYYCWFIYIERDEREKRESIVFVGTMGLSPIKTTRGTTPGGANPLYN
jgi:hypothetical protein